MPGLSVSFRAAEASDATQGAPLADGETAFVPAFLAGVRQHTTDEAVRRTLEVAFRLPAGSYASQYLPGREALVSGVHGNGRRQSPLPSLSRFTVLTPCDRRRLFHSLPQPCRRGRRAAQGHGPGGAGRCVHMFGMPCPPYPLFRRASP